MYSEDAIGSTFLAELSGTSRPGHLIGRAPHGQAEVVVRFTARGRVTQDRRRIFEGSGEIYLADESLAVSAQGRYARLPLNEISSIDPETLGWRVY